MDMETLALAVGFDGYLLALALVLRADIVRFGRAMIAGVWVGFIALVFGEITVLGNRSEFGTAMAAASIASIVLIVRALWTRRDLLTQPLYPESEHRD